MLFDNGTPSGSDTATQQADFVERRLLGDRYYRHIGHDGVLRESRGAHLQYN
jgi:hypothetical protein